MVDVLHLGLPGGEEKLLYIRQEDKDEHLPGKLRTAAKSGGIQLVHASLDEDGGRTGGCDGQSITARVLVHGRAEAPAAPHVGALTGRSSNIMSMR